MSSKARNLGIAGVILGCSIFSGCEAIVGGLIAQKIINDSRKTNTPRAGIYTYSQWKDKNNDHAWTPDEAEGLSDRFWANQPFTLTAVTNRDLREWGYWLVRKGEKNNVEHQQFYNTDLGYLIINPNGNYPPGFYKIIVGDPETAFAEKDIELVSFFNNR